MSLGYAAEKFSAAVSGIVTLPETLTPQAKLEIALMGTHTLTADDLPANLRSTFQKWRDDLTRVQDAEEGSFRATIKTLKPEDLLKHLKTFYDLYWQVDDAWRIAKKDTAAGAQ